MKPNYHCTQDELYAGLYLLANSLEEELVEFTNFKTKYNPVFLAAFRQGIADAENMPDDDQRDAQHQVMRIHLVNMTDGEVRDALGKLRSYIKSSFTDKAEAEVRLQEAGFEDYEEAMNNNWDKLKSILNNARMFTDAYEPVLVTGGMPAGFVAEMTGVCNTVRDKVDEFLNLVENTKQGTEAKVAANNVLYAQAMMICGDGQEIFRKQEAKRSQFVWNSIMEIVTPPGSAGLRGDVKESGTNVPLEGVSVKIQKEGGLILIADTDVAGKFAFGNLEPGVYTGVVMKTGYVSFNIEVTISTGVTSFKHWLLAPL